MAVTDYFTINGKLHGQSISGINPNSFILSYGTDALGSVVTTYNGGSVQNTYRYKPYGGALAKTGVGIDPPFRWVGGGGYRALPNDFSEYYVRARHFATTLGFWSSKDMFWPQQQAYTYSFNSPTCHIDESGNLVALPYWSAETPWILRTGGASSSYIYWYQIPNATGYIIQHIKQAGTVTTWSGQGLLVPPCEYYESWCVFKSSAGPVLYQGPGCTFRSAKPNDSFTTENVPFSNYPFTVEFKITGDYKFYKQTEIKNFFSKFTFAPEDKCRSRAGLLLTASKFDFGTADGFQRLDVISEHINSLSCYILKSERTPFGGWHVIQDCGAPV